MSPEEAFLLVLSKLEACDIPYMITGSFASNLHGVPRATFDADVVIESDPKRLDAFLSAISAGFYVSNEAAREALQNKGMFNIVHLDTGFKVDVIIKKTRTFSSKEFSRREKVTLMGRPCWFATAEDTIVAKLEWYRLGDSEKQFMDALNVARVQGDKLDRGYLQRWAEELELRDLLEKLFQQLVT